MGVFGFEWLAAAPTNRRLAAASVFAIASMPALANATSMQGLGVAFIGFVFGLSAALILVVLTVVLLSTKHRGFAGAMRFIAPILGVAYPVAMVAFGARTDDILTSLYFDLPVMVLAAVTTGLAIKRS